MENELLPCPWCKAGVTTFRENTHWTGMRSQLLSVELLHHCEKTSPLRAPFLTFVGTTKEEAIAAWNTRPQPDTKPNAAEALAWLDEEDKKMQWMANHAAYVSYHGDKPPRLDPHPWSSIIKTIRTALQNAAPNGNAAEALEALEVSNAAEIYEEEREKYLGGLVEYPNNQVAFTACMRKALCYLDTGNDYLPARRAVAELSGIPAMAITFDKHIETIKTALQNQGAGDDVIKKLLGKIRQKKGFYSVSDGFTKTHKAHRTGILKGLDIAEKCIIEEIPAAPTPNAGEK